MHDYPAPTCSLLGVPTEIRFSIFKLCLPCYENLVLDPKYKSDRGSSYRYSYEATASLLRVSKQVSVEVAPLVYSHNIPTILHPVVSSGLEEYLSTNAMKHIRRMEVRIERSLGELGGFWQELSGLPALTQMKLTCYQSKDWRTLVGELAWKACEAKAFSLKLELHESVWAQEAMMNTKNRHIKSALNWGE